MRKNVCSFDVASIHIGWAIGSTTSDPKEYIPIKSGTLHLLDNFKSKELTYTERQKYKFRLLVPELTKIVKLIKDNNVEVVCFELSTHGQIYTMQMLSQYVGFFKSFLWMCEIKNIIPLLEYKTFNASQWQSNLWPNEIKKLTQELQNKKSFEVREVLREHKKVSKNLSLSRCKYLFNLDLKGDDDQADAININSCALIVNDIGYDKTIKMKFDRETKKIKAEIIRVKNDISINRNKYFDTIKSISDKKYLKKDFDDMFKRLNLIEQDLLDKSPNAIQLKVLLKYNDSITKIKSLNKKLREE